MLDGNGDSQFWVDIGADEFLLATPPQPSLSAYYNPEVNVIHLDFNAAYFHSSRKAPGEDLWFMP